MKGEIKKNEKETKTKKRNQRIVINVTCNILNSGGDIYDSRGYSHYSGILYL